MASSAPVLSMIVIPSKKTPTMGRDGLSSRHFHSRQGHWYSPPGRRRGGAAGAGGETAQEFFDAATFNLTDLVDSVQVHTVEGGDPYVVTSRQGGDRWQAGLKSALFAVPRYEQGAELGTSGIFSLIKNDFFAFFI